jgi:thiamine biosynthesis lipoprotein
VDGHEILFLHRFESANLVRKMPKAKESAGQKFRLLIIFLVWALFFLGCGQKESVFSGRTMGTTYRVKVVTGFFQRDAGLQEKIDARLDEINRSMSTYLVDSEISRFNHLAPVGEKFRISTDFMQVMQTAKKIFLLSDGAWDGTVKPLIDLWGFGSGGTRSRPPTKEEIRQRLRVVGFSSIEIIDDCCLAKNNASVSLDLASIAKGYAVDQIAALMKAGGAENYLVEIGGEVYAAGHRKDGNPWRVGINTPRAEASASQVYRAVRLSGRAMATSGDYRNYFEFGGKRYTHVIDPRNGYPVENGVVSATVLADDCVFADGLATALMVMDPGNGLALVDRLDGVECLIVVMQADGSLVDHYSKEFPKPQ